MKKHYFELDKVDSITLTGERETEYRWFQEIPSRPRKFLGFQIGKTSAIPAGWNEYVDENGNEKYQDDRTKTSYFEGHKSYRVDEVNKRIYNKAHVEIRLGYKQSFGINFIDNTEAQKYVDDLINSSEKQFHVIVNI
jgi:hypothetical protein